MDDPIRNEQLKQLRDGPQAPAFSTRSVSENLVENPEFDDGLISWSTTGDVTHASAEAILADADPTSAILYQTISTPPGEYVVSFDYQPALSDEVEPGFARDTFFASLYFFDDEGTFDLSGAVFDDAQGLMDQDAFGAFNVVGTIEPSAEKGPGWFHFSYVFNQTYDHVAVAFELAGLNGEAGDSEMFIDNVMLIPEPGTFGLLSFALVLLGLRRYRRGVL